jgi:hypothetical protein
MLATIALLAGVGTFCVLLYTSAVYALPVTIGLSAGFWAMHAGAGTGSILIGAAAGALTLTLGELAVVTNRSPQIRWTVLLAFTLPAIIAGYSMILQICELGISSLVWCHIFAVVGAGAIGFAVVTRLLPQPVSQPAAGVTGSMGRSAFDPASRTPYRHG